MTDNTRPGWLQELVAPRIGRRAQGRPGARNPGLDRLRAREDGTVYHTYTVAAPDPFVAPYFQLPCLDRTPKSPRPRRAPLLAQGRVPGLERSGSPVQTRA